ncbi:hypothetical protein F2Z20_22015 [Bacteroides finegoldii]|uniref:Transposase n=1 Tax=Bacteroides finegoldii TaxID=338188 RepID=A0A7J4YHW3_9BACE|nr:hypothetical protein F2Z28_20850 [Bacteroides finegoldii]KAA5216563.1 hypothetical protein F2Z16_20835 [Bacteroides finegoldii]KAA5221272.1 hypothetical protein F2Z20_22015 [Bacteroides finegoldii]KAA5225681.1 hypothetical protein F2Z22_22005 [Bacteroides finegoldii]KAA5230197.1 hypothetical protein F2Z17_20925 [Bacteroides finegoldii]
MRFYIKKNKLQINKAYRSAHCDTSIASIFYYIR